VEKAENKLGTKPSHVSNEIPTKHTIEKEWITVVYDTIEDAFDSQ
jgi:hypothetical protein